MQFLFPVLAVGFAFLVVPPLVHLINMLRHRRQQWAAMEFLLAAYKKQKRWIILRQLLLLLARIAVAAALIAMLAGWKGGQGWLDELGGQTTHHVVVLDDSYSMADTSGATSAYQRALAALDGLSRRLAAAEGKHQITIIRTSRAALVTRGGSTAGDAAADLSSADLDNDLRAVERVMATRPSPLDDDCGAALDLAVDLIKATGATRTVLYVMSDFREVDWDAPERIKEAVGSMARVGAEVRFIDCAAAPAPNLTVEQLEPIPDVWVAGVPVVFRVTVSNHSSTPARNVNLLARVIRYGGSTTAFDPTARVSGAVENLPAVVFEQIPAGGKETKQFQVYIPEPGTHAVEVELPEDALNTDNRRVATLPLSEASKVLIVDGDPEGKGAYLVSSVLDPGGQVRTGLLPDVQPSTFLRSARASDLAPYRAIFLIDVPEIDASAADALQNYVESGGGLAMFIGSGVLVSRYNEVLRGGERRLLPGQLTEPVMLDSSGATGAPDITMGAPHPLSAPLAAVGDAALSLVGVRRTMGISLSENPTQPVDQVFVRRDGDPLVLTHEVGDGRVVTVLAGLDESWTNWPRDPTFVVFVLRTNAYLWSSSVAATSRAVGEPVEFVLPLDEYGRSITYLPAVDTAPRIPFEELAEEKDDALTVRFDPITEAIDGGDNVDALLQPGLSEYWLSRLDGSPETRLSASVVNGAEGNLTRADHNDVQSALLPATVSFHEAGDVVAADESSGGGILSLLLLALLALLLAAEQLLAFWASYHPPTQGVRA